MNNLIVIIRGWNSDNTIRHKQSHGLKYQYHCKFKDRNWFGWWFLSKWEYGQTLIEDIETVKWRQGFRVLWFTFEKLWYTHPTAVVCIAQGISYPKEPKGDVGNMRLDKAPRGLHSQ